MVLWFSVSPPPGPGATLVVAQLKKLIGAKVLNLPKGVFKVFIKILQKHLLVDFYGFRCLPPQGPADT